MTETIHQLKVTLRQVKPPVWRRIVVTSDLTLGELSPVLEAAMGWLGGHLHVFDIGGVRYGMPDPDWGTDDLDENRFRLGEVLPAVGMKMRWDYDFGDGWEHDVLVEAISLPQRGVGYPVCLAGRRACPPEDCGGPSGYPDLLEALVNPDHPERSDAFAAAPRGLVLDGNGQPSLRSAAGRERGCSWDVSAVGERDDAVDDVGPATAKLPVALVRNCR